MKLGRDIQSLAAELQRQADSKSDYIVPSSKLMMKENALINFAETDYQATENFHNQIATKLEIPSKYYDKMRSEAPELLSKNVNEWLGKRKASHMIRTLDGKARAFLSDRYKPLDNIDVAQAALPALIQNGATIESCEVTENKLYLKAVTNRLQYDLGLDDPCQAGLVISNSEVGNGSLSVRVLLFRLVCKNGLIAPKELGGFSATHLGAKHVDAGYIDYSNSTKQKIQSAFFAQLSETVNSFFVPANFENIVNKMRAAKGDIIEDPIETIKLVSKEFLLKDTEEKGILNYLIKGGELNKFGVFNAVNRYAQDVDSYDRSTDLEIISGKIVELNPTQWEAIAA